MILDMPALASRRLRAGDVVIMDNPPAQKVRGALRRIEPVGANLQNSPPCSPGFNPIEMAFTKLRGPAARAVAEALRRFTPQDRANGPATAGREAN
jgi:transposase